MKPEYTRAVPSGLTLVTKASRVPPPKVRSGPTFTGKSVESVLPAMYAFPPLSSDATRLLARRAADVAEIHERRTGRGDLADVAVLIAVLGEVRAHGDRERRVGGVRVARDVDVA